MASGDVEDVKSLQAVAKPENESFAYRTFKNTLSGTIGGIAVCLVGHPFDTLKVRLQTQPVDRPVYKGLTDCFVKTMKWEGVGGLYKGVGGYIWDSSAIKAKSRVLKRNTRRVFHTVVSLIGKNMT